MITLLDHIIDASSRQYIATNQLMNVHLPHISLDPECVQNDTRNSTISPPKLLLVRSYVTDV